MEEELVFSFVIGHCLATYVTISRIRCQCIWALRHHGYKTGQGTYLWNRQSKMTECFTVKDWNECSNQSFLIQIALQETSLVPYWTQFVWAPCSQQNQTEGSMFRGVQFHTEFACHWSRATLVRLPFIALDSNHAKFLVLGIKLLPGTGWELQRQSVIWNGSHS